MRELSLTGADTSAANKTRIMALNQKLTHVIANRVVAKVEQDGMTLTIGFTDGSTMRIKMEAETSSVMIRDHSSKLEYTD